MTPKQIGILSHVAVWAASYPCIEVVHVFGSIARDEPNPGDIDIAFEYVESVRSDPAMVTYYTNVNEDWDNLVELLLGKFGHQPRATGLFPFNEPYDHTAWSAIGAGRKIGRIGKAIMTWTAPK
jgi:predicted nucleotidyltransferase